MILNNAGSNTFRELGKVVRAVFLLRYIEDVELRKIINTATNKSEEYNGFTKWAFFGDETVITENIQHEQRKIVKYNYLVSNMINLRNVVQMTWQSVEKPNTTN